MASGEFVTGGLYNESVFIFDEEGNNLKEQSIAVFPSPVLEAICSSTDEGFVATVRYTPDEPIADKSIGIARFSENALKWKFSLPQPDKVSVSTTSVVLLGSETYGVFTVHDSWQGHLAVIGLR